MTSTAATADAYIDSLSDAQKPAMVTLRETVLANLPTGFAEGMGYGMLCYSVPFSIYPAGYHCGVNQPLGWVSIAAQKNFIALYHMGLYSMPQLMHWFITEWPKHTTAKLDMGKSCIRFKKPEAIPFALIGELMQKITPQEWIATYESLYKPKAKSKQ